MTEEEYLRMKNILNTVIVQQAVLTENNLKAEARVGDLENRMTRNAEAISALLTIAQIHEQEITRTNEQMNRRFEELAKKSSHTDDRINALVNVVERYISKN